MKKEIIPNFVIIIGLLVLCVIALVAVYATVPQSSVLLLDESFHVLDENTWTQETSECREEDEQFHYVTHNENNSVIVDGVLRVFANLTSENVRSNRRSPHSCFSCKNSTNSSDDCITSFISGKIQSKHKFDAESGRIEVRAKVNPVNRKQLYIKVSFGENTKELGDLADLLVSENNTIKNNSAELKIFFESEFTQSILKSPITDGEFHIYQVNWKNGKIYLNVDNEKVDEKDFSEGVDSVKEKSPKETVKSLNDTSISQPFHITLGIHIEQELLEETNIDEYSNSTGSLKNTSNYAENEWSGGGNVLEVDYLRLFRNVN